MLAQLCLATDRLVTTIMITNNVDEALLLSDRIVPMTSGPGATLGPSVAVAMPRPRMAAQLQHDDEALRVRTHVIERLTEYVKSARVLRRPAVRPAATDTEEPSPAIVVPMENES